MRIHLDVTGLDASYDDEHCAKCGRKLRGKRQRVRLQRDPNGEWYATDTEVMVGDATTFLAPIGPECARGLPAAVLV